MPLPRELRTRGRWMVRRILAVTLVALGGVAAGTHTAGVHTAGVDTAGADVGEAAGLAFTPNVRLWGGDLTIAYGELVLIRPARHGSASSE